ncbi:hypothetical protein RRG08_052274 [Elysia crispata]|uniref:G-protein coupled receptors family 1 profile domain-containing protein n=1 Tax=Elysia crispata TaxID=231223 RepID=A0AAE1DPQ7_9GAST|nr:hypothetical protein RRG08_052274 [Elysia crispata]
MRIRMFVIDRSTLPGIRIQLCIEVLTKRQYIQSYDIVMELVDSNETLYYPYLLQRPEDFNPWINDARWLGNYSDYNDYSDYSNYSDYSYIDYDYRRLATGSPETYYWRVGLFGIGGTAVCCCGVICNIVAIIVLSRLRTDSSAPVLLMCLSGFDCVYLLSLLCLETLMVLCGAGLITRHYRPVIAPAYGYLFAVPLVCQTCTAYIVVVITLERFIAIVLPFRAQAICKLENLCHYRGLWLFVWFSLSCPFADLTFCRI